MQDQTPSTPRRIRLDHPHATAQLIGAIREPEPDFAVIQQWLEEHPDLYTSVMSRANQLRVGGHRRPIYQLQHAAVFLGLGRLRQMIARHLDVDPAELSPADAVDADLGVAGRPALARRRDNLPFL